MTKFIIKFCLIFNPGFPKKIWAWILKFPVEIYIRIPKEALEGKISCTI